jgi:hypothetical protein
MSDRRRHGEDEDRSAGGARREIRHSLRDRLIGYLPRYARLASALAPLVNLRDRVPFLAKLSEKVAGFSAKRPCRNGACATSILRTVLDHLIDPPCGRVEIPKEFREGMPNPEVVLFADTFNRYHERENLDAAVAVLTGAGYRVHLPKPLNGSSRPLCCGRTFLTAGLVDEARTELERTFAALLPVRATRVPIVGLETLLRFTFRDEAVSLSLLPVYGGGDASGEGAGARHHPHRANAQLSPNRLCCSRNSWRRKSMPAASIRRSRPSDRPRCCTAIAIKALQRDGTRCRRCCRKCRA